jgi:hypothetical protein
MARTIRENSIMMPRPKTAGKCGCGRSPTGRCCGWHALTEEAYQAKLAEFNAPLSGAFDLDESDEIEREKAINNDLEAYRQQAMDLWFDAGGSCTGSKGTPNIN